MRKHILDSAPLPIDTDRREWYKLQELAVVDVTSEADGYPVESALNFGTGPGWRAALPGKQHIRLVFDQPQWIQRMRLQFNEAEVERTQEFTVRWSGGSDEPFKEVVRQQWNFSPDGSTRESEDYVVDLKGVSILELTIDPDLGTLKALANLADWLSGITVATSAGEPALLSQVKRPGHTGEPQLPARSRWASRGFEPRQ